MSREWKPGDVALVRIGQQSIWARAMLSADGSEWICSWAGGGHTHPINHRDLDVRPLVVIDPENREDVERLVDAFGAASDPSRSWADQMQAALRNLADPKPPKPEEPTGLGAVVETSHGELYVRDKTTTTVAHWKRARGEDGGRRYKYRDLSVVRVLSEGVQS